MIEIRVNNGITCSNRSIKNDLRKKGSEPRDIFNYLNKDLRVYYYDYHYEF